LGLEGSAVYIMLLGPPGGPTASSSSNTDPDWLNPQPNTAICNHN